VFRRRPPPADTRAIADRAAADDQERLILSALEDLRDTTVREVMTPRVDVVGLPIPIDAAEVADAVRRSGHSVFPVYDDDPDNLIGVLYVNDLFRAGWQINGNDVRRVPEGAVDHGSKDGTGTEVEGAGRGVITASANESPGDQGLTLTPLDISRRIRSPYMVPESRRVLDVLSDMRRDRRSFAVVVDEYGGMAGVLSVKDLLSALVGDLRDEFDSGKEPDVIRVDRTRWLVDGGTSLDDIREQLGLDLPEGEYVTLGGYLFDAFGHIPEEGERLEVGGWELRVAEMDRRRVAKVVAQMSEKRQPVPGDSLPSNGL
jgi:CBS domain containing-hemolysin-like protein